MQAPLTMDMPQNGVLPATARPGLDTRVISCVAATALVLFLRFPEGLLNAQLWAEDGVVFFKDAFTQPGLGTVIKPYAGYLHLAPRFIMYVLVGLSPIEDVPLYANLISIVIAAFSLGFFASVGFRYLVASDHVRWLTAVLVAGCHPATEILSTATNTNWYLTIASLLLVIARVDSLRMSLVYAALTLLICFTSPLTLCVAPLALIIAIRRRGAGRLSAIALLAGMAAHAIVVMTWVPEHAARKTYFDYASVTRFTLDGMMGAVLVQSYGFDIARWFYRHQGGLASAIAAAVNAAAILGLVLWNGDRPRRIHIVIAVILFCVFLATRSITMPPHDTSPQGYLFKPPSPFGTRYFFHPYCLGAFVMATAWDCLASAAPRLRTTGRCVIGVVITANLLSCPRQSLLDHDWKANIQQARRNGWAADIQINPPGWVLELRGRQQE